MQYTPSRLVLRLLSIACVLVPLAPAARAQVLADEYLKSEVMIPMRDGVELFTQIYEPLDAGGEQLPILMKRTPYGIGFYGEEVRRPVLGPSAVFNPSKYIYVHQDVRGKFRSQGEFEVMKPVYSQLVGPDETDEATDTYDTIEWLLENVPDHNGRVGQWGISYPGWQTAMGMIDAHPAMKASSPQASPSDMFIGDDFHHNGAFRLMYTFSWLSSYAAVREGQSENENRQFDYGTTNGYDFFLDLGPIVNVNRRYFHERVPTWNEYMEHGSYDAYWKSHNLLPHMRDITPTVLNVAGWFDAEDFYGPMSIYYEIERNDPANKSVLVVGPWSHGGWAGSAGTSLGDIPFDQPTGQFYREEIEFPFFEGVLKGDGTHDLPEALVFETGANEWRRFDHWPPTDARPASLYLRADGGLAFDGPSGDAVAGAFDEFTSDPAHPVPFSATPGTHQGHVWMVEDQRFASERDDVLVYQTPPLEEDVVVAGPLIANLFVSTTGTDADWIVKLVDVFPGDSPASVQPVGEGERGFEMLVGGEVMRGKFRESSEQPRPFVPGEVTQVRFDLRDKFHRFRKGHRIMVQIQSSWFPVIDRNPQSFVDIYHAEAEAFQIAQHRVHRAPEAASRIEVQLLPASSGGK